MELIGKVLIHMYGLIIEWGIGQGKQGEVAILIGRNFVRLAHVTIGGETLPCAGDPDVTGEHDLLFYSAGTPLLVAANIADMIAKDEVDNSITYTIKVDDEELKDLDNKKKSDVLGIDWALEAKMWRRQHAMNQLRKEKNGAKPAQQANGDSSPF